MCSSNPCMHNAACVIELSGYECTCIAGFSGVICETGTISLDYFLLLQPFPFLGSAHKVFNLHSPPSPVLRFICLYFFLIHVFTYNITRLQFRSSYLSVSTHFHLLITTSPHSLIISISLLLFSHLPYST